MASVIARAQRHVIDRIANRASEFLKTMSRDDNSMHPNLLDHCWTASTLKRRLYGQAAARTAATLEEIMSHLRPAAVGTAIAIILTLGLHGTNAQQAAPKDNKGFSTSKTEVVELGPEIDGMMGRQLRLRILNIEPGGHIGIHSHKNRPAVVYVVKGTTTVYAADGTKKVVSTGQTASANKDTTHWHVNEGKEPVVFIAVDVFQPKK